MTTATNFRRLAVEEVRRAKEKTGATIVRGLCCKRDGDDLCACPIGVVALATYGQEEGHTGDAAGLLGLNETYWCHFVEAFDNPQCPPPSEESRASLGDFVLAMVGWEDGREIARAMFGGEVVA